MKRYILTGTPGSGKTTLIRALETKDHSVIEEAATDIIAREQALGNAEPWTTPDFIDKIIALQKQRQLQTTEALQFYDRSPICTYALALYLNFEPSPTLMEEIERIEKDRIYEKKVFFIENLGFVTPTNARKISYEDSLKFEKFHINAYTKFGYELIKIPAALVLERIEEILRFITEDQRNNL